jgi:type II secretory pathway pseudopilin PulG
MRPITLLHSRRGFALEATLFVLLLLAVLCAFAVTGVTTTTRTANYDYRNARTIYAAEAASDDIMQQLSGMVNDGFISQEELDSLGAPYVPGFTIPNMSVQPVGGATQETVNDGPFAGLYALIRNYDISTRAVDSLGDASRAVVSVKAAAIPIFQFGVFYEKDLEITNGPRLDFAGWVHSNGKIYIKSNNSFYHNQITTPNTFHYRRKDGASAANGVFIDDAGGTQRQVLYDSDSFGTWAAFRTWSENTFSGRLKTNAYGVDSLRLPLPGGVPAAELIAAREGADTQDERDTKFSWKADWYIEIDYDRLDNVCTDPLAITAAPLGGLRAPGLVAPTPAECALIFTGLQNAWWESREQTFVDELNVDVQALFNWIGANVTRRTRIMFITFRNLPLVPETFVSTRGCPAGAGCSFRAYPIVRLRNATTLAGPITITTDFPMYVQGNYNSNGAQWQPAALVADAFTWLSPGFDQTGHLDRPAGAGTVTGGVTRWTRKFASTGAATVYAALLAGHSATPFDDVTPAGVPAGCNPAYAGGSAAYFYGGGLENFPRFLENWSGVQTLYRGSLVSVSFAQRASDLCAWSGSYYNPPARDWAFETRFLDPANLPPGTPVVGSVVQTAYRPVFE